MLNYSVSLQLKMMEFQTDRKPGDFGLRAFYPKDEKGQYDMQMKELRNGRLAMLAYSGIVTAAVLTGKPWPFFATKPEGGDKTKFASGSTLCGSGIQKSGRGLKISAKALEACKSLPFLPKPKNLAGYVGEEQEFDPLQFSDTFDMKWLREAELKHGRVCMLATVGFVVQQYVKFPGFPNPENSLDAFWQAPGGAWATLIFLVGFIESSSYGGKITMLDMFEDTDREPGDFDFGPWKLSKKPEDAASVKDIKLKELNNGRLAMMAIGGMIHHNLVVNGPLFPLFPDGWEGPQGTWKTESFMTFIYSGGI